MLCCQPELKNLPFDHLCYSKKIPRSIDWSKMLKSRHNKSINMKASFCFKTLSITAQVMPSPNNHIHLLPLPSLLNSKLTKMRHFDGTRSNWLLNIAKNELTPQNPQIRIYRGNAPRGTTHTAALLLSLIRWFTSSSYNKTNMLEWSTDQPTDWPSRFMSVNVSCTILYDGSLRNACDQTCISSSTFPLIGSGRFWRKHTTAPFRKKTHLCRCYVHSKTIFQDSDK